MEIKSNELMKVQDELISTQDKMQKTTNLKQVLATEKESFSLQVNELNVKMIALSNQNTEYDL